MLLENFSSDGIAESGFGSNRLLVFEVAQEVKSVRVLGVTLDSKLTFETHLWEVVSKPNRCLGVVR